MQPTTMQPTLTVPAPILRSALTLARKFTPRRAARPAIENIRLSWDAQSLVIVATDLETYYRASIPHPDTGETGTAVVLVNPHTLAELVAGKGKDDTVTLAIEGESLRAQVNGGSGALLRTHDPEEFPFWPSADHSPLTGTVPATALRSAVNAVLPAVAREQGRYAMHGAMFDVTTGAFVGTDGKRLHVAPVPEWREASALPLAPIIPRDSLRLLLTILPSKGAATAVLVFSSTYLHVNTPNASFACRLIDGEFPRYRAVIPSEQIHSLETDSSAFLSALARCKAVISKDARAVRLSLGRKSLVLHARSMDGGQATETVECIGSHDGTEIAFNPDFAREAIEACGTDRVRVSFNDRTSPLRFDPIGGGKGLAIIMPITVDV